MNVTRRTSERGQNGIELGLELRDSSELDAQLPFGIGKPLVHGRDRFEDGVPSSRASGRGS